MRSFIRTRLRRALVGIPLVVALLAMTVSISGCKSLFDKRPASRTMAAPAPRVPTGAEKFAAASDTLSTSLEAATRAFARGSSDATAIAAVRDFAEQLPKLDKGVAADFAKTRKILSKVDSADKDAIQAKVERTYAERKAALATRLAAVSSAETTAALKSSIVAAADYLDSITPEEPYQPLGTSLPHRIVDAKAGPPVLGARIAPAYAPNTPGAEPSTLPVTPTPEDTTQTVEVVFTPEITSLVASLGADPVRMYEYVRNTIDFEPYYGSRKGATETLLEGSGNDIDTASLLIALYRKANIPARYVSGVVDVPIDKAMNWVGVETPEAAAKLFSAGGTPTKLLISGGKPEALQIEHTWAEVYVDYEDYRGAGAGSGEKVWVPLDGSFKEYEYAPGRAVVGSARMMQIAASSLASGAVVTTDSATNVDLVGLRHALVGEVATVPGLASVNPFVDGRRGIKVSNARVLPALLPFAGSPAAEFYEVPQSARVTVAIRLPGAAAYTTATASIAGKRVSVYFAGATPGDCSILEAVDSVDKAPAYAVDVVPRLEIDGLLVAQGTPMLLGSTAHIEFEDGVFNCVRRGASAIVAGGVYALVFDLGRPTPQTLEVRQRTMASALARIESLAPSDPIGVPDSEAVLADGLSAMGLIYFMRLDAAYDLTGPLAGVVAVQQIAEATIGTVCVVSSVLGEPVSLRPQGVAIDVRQDARTIQSRTGDADQEVSFMLGVGAIGSYLEGSTIESLLGVGGISTMRILQLANNSGIPIRVVDAGNISKIDAMQYDEALKAALRSEVAGGRLLVIPDAPVEAYGFRGTGWIVQDPMTGDAGYMIVSGLAGGMSLDLDVPASVDAMAEDLVAFLASPTRAYAWADEPVSGQQTHTSEERKDAAFVQDSLVYLVSTTLAAMSSANLAMRIQVLAFAWGLWKSIGAMVTLSKQYKRLDELSRVYGQPGQYDTSIRALQTEITGVGFATLGAQTVAFAALVGSVKIGLAGQANGGDPNSLEKGLRGSMMAGFLSLVVGQMVSEYAIDTQVTLENLEQDVRLRGHYYPN